MLNFCNEIGPRWCKCVILSARIFLPIFLIFMTLIEAERWSPTSDELFLPKTAAHRIFSDRNFRLPFGRAFLLCNCSQITRWRPWLENRGRGSFGSFGHEEVISFGSILFSAVASDFRKVSCIIVFGFKLKCESFEMRKVWRVIALWEAEMTWELEH